MPRFGRRRRFGRSKRPLDWVTQNATYNFGSPPVLIADGSIDFTPLTLHRDIVESGASVTAGPRYPQLEQTVVRIRGTIWCWILPTTSWWDTLTGRTFFQFRIGTGLQVQETGQTIGAIGDLSTPSGGNEDFMWEHTEYFIAQSAWGDMTVDPSLYIRRIDVDIRVKRRLKQPNACMLWVQYGPGMDYAGGAEAFPDGVYDMQLRTLLQTNT